MLDFLFELLLAIAEPILEGLLELFAGVILDFIARLFSGAFEALENAPQVVAAIVYVVLGLLAGECSLLMFPHHLVRPSRIPGVSLVVSPVFAGAALSLVGSFLRTRNKTTARIETFRYGYAFAFGMALIRLLFAR